jgi:alpha-tubulin suppressor-like RCC1 family protein
LPRVAAGHGKGPLSRLKSAMTRFALVPAAPGGKPLARRLVKRLGGLAALLVVLALGCDQVPPTSPERAQTHRVGADALLTFGQVSAGGQHTCGVTPTDVAYCWGYNGWGQLGDGSAVEARVHPSLVVGGLTFRQVSAGENHTCGVTTSNVAYCWGIAGALGNGTELGSVRPVRVVGGLAFRSVSAGTHHTCGVTPTNVMYCWGRNFSGQLGDGTRMGRLQPVRVAGGLAFRGVSAGGGHTCGVTTGNVAYCWGVNEAGQLGNGTRTGPQTCSDPFIGDVACSTRPVQVAGGLAFRQVNAGAGRGGVGHTCGLTTSNVAYCWGNNGSGGLGDGTRTLRVRPVRVVGGLTFRGVNAGTHHTCGVTTTDVAWCWGGNSSGQLGDDTRADRLRPVRVVGGFAFRDVSAGEEHTCGVTPTNVAYCWGDNFYGELGDGTTILRTRPVRRVG